MRCTSSRTHEAAQAAPRTAADSRPDGCIRRTGRCSSRWSCRRRPRRPCGRPVAGRTVRERSGHVRPLGKPPRPAQPPRTAPGRTARTMPSRRGRSARSSSRARRTSRCTSADRLAAPRRCPCANSASSRLQAWQRAKDEGRRTGESRRMSSGEATPGPSRRSIGADGSAAKPPPTRAAILPARPAIAHDCQPGRAEKPEKQVMPRYAHLDGRREAEFARAHGPRCRARPRGGRGKERGGCWRRRTSARAPQMPETRLERGADVDAEVHRLAQSRAGERPAAQRPHRSATMSRATAGGPEAMPNGLALGNTIPPHAAPPRSPADGIGG